LVFAYHFPFKKLIINAVNQFKKKRIETCNFLLILPYFYLDVYNLFSLKF
jgi:hypothetical protein